MSVLGLGSRQQKTSSRSQSDVRKLGPNRGLGQAPDCSRPPAPGLGPGGSSGTAAAPLGTRIPPWAATSTWKFLMDCAVSRTVEAPPVTLPVSPRVQASGNVRSWQARRRPIDVRACRGIDVAVCHSSTAAADASASGLWRPLHATTAEVGECQNRKRNGTARVFDADAGGYSASML